MPARRPGWSKVDCRPLDQPAPGARSKRSIYEETSGLSRFAEALSVTPDPAEPGSTLLIAGELDVATAEALVSAVTAFVPASTPPLTLDLSGVAFVDSSGLGALVRVAHQVAEGGGRVRLRGVSSQVQRLLDITSVASQFDIEPPFGPASD